MGEGLRDWLPMIFNTAQPWLSSADIRAGFRWFSEVGATLDGSNLGVMCMTAQNLQSPWPHFEAGALSKSVSIGRMLPYLLDVNTDELRPPFLEFQFVKADRAGTLSLVTSLASLDDSAIRTREQLLRSFELLWLRSQTFLRKHARFRKNIMSLLS